MTLSPEGHELDFTEAHYRANVRTAKVYYAFEHYGTRSDEPHVLWRHDVDCSPHRALALARIEAEEEVTATYCFLLHSDFYNLLEPAVMRRVREILSLGHRLGLHFDAAVVQPADEAELERALARERAILEDVFGAPVEAFSFHNPDFRETIGFDEDEYAGMLSTYGATLRRGYHYVSDSNGYWRFKRLADVLGEREHPRLHVLTHPEWWQAEPMSPRARIARCIEGRAHRVGADYDAILPAIGRLNVGA
jgi:hypothetical protein